MAFDALEIIIIGVILVVIFMWGPGKIPELARAIGRARKEFDDASKGFSGALSTMTQPSQPVQQAPSKTGDQILVETAQQLGINTEGKTREQVSQEIMAKTKSSEKQENN